MPDQLGKYNDGQPIYKGDFVRTYRDTVVNVLERCEGGIVCSPMDEWGDYDWMHVGTFEDYCIDLIRRWDDPAIFIGAYI